ncbi:glycosyltransferase family 4 protein [Aeoliella sp. ICT_H6.2]|uniref:Glycosyltransferase family 4 protein n=1 Tax=Aeoliella straminimaris TaxID=2954799 RepID=A0A9X2JK05_9BACT|nr:glycosyltransferase family 4 protein [Aeoliella straminimaris]MCO6047428.1 glycosyltransferase family 4 protein [Aeoliella straminimaris]
MNVWLLHVGEELPVDETPRLFRYGHLANALADRGHQVLRWAPTFQHFRKRQRWNHDHRVDVNDRYAIEFIHSPGYIRNASLARWKSYSILGRRLAERLQHESPPDLIVTGIPSLEWCTVAVDYAERHNVPVVLDVRDLWPDIYLHLLPRSLQPLGELALTPLRRQLRSACQRATAIYGVSQSYLDWGLKHAGRAQTSNDRVVPLGYHRRQLEPSEHDAQLADLAAHGIRGDKLLCVFAGLIERMYDVETIVRAARLLEQRSPGKFQFVICGAGSKLPAVRRAAADLDSVKLLGWVTQPTILALLEMASVGLATYTAGAPQSLPNKPFEYMSAGLPIVTSLPGELPSLLGEHRCGVHYDAGDAESLATAIGFVVDDPKYHAEMGERSRQLFLERFNSPVVYTDFCDSLERVAGVPTQPQLGAAA